MSEETRLYRSQIYTDDRMISEREAAERSAYVRAFVLHGKVVRAEVINRRAIHHVIYYNRIWPDSDLADYHRNHYSGVPFEVWGLPTAALDGTVIAIFEIDGGVRLRRRIRRTLDERGNPRQEYFIAPDGADLGSFHYEYRSGELYRVVEKRPDGTERVEFEDRDLEFQTGSGGTGNRP